MATEIIMPKAGMAMEEGKIIRWLKDIGDPVESGEGVMEIETDKITMENESPVSGVLLAKLFDDGETVPVTTVIGYVGKKGEAIPQAAPQLQPAAEVAATKSPEPPPEPGPAAPDRILATPYAKKLAAENGVPLSNIEATGTGGVIKARDIEKAVKATPLAARIAADKGIALETVQGTGYGGKITSADLAVSSGARPAKPEAPVQTEALAGIRGVIARRMSQSHNEIPPVTMNMKAYVDELLALRAKINRDREQKITINDFVVKACAKAVAVSREMRTEIDMEKKTLTVRQNVHIAVATSMPGGLVVPVVKDADRLSVSEISLRIKELVSRAKSGALTPDESTGSVFTVSNIGSTGVHDFTPIINQPNAAIMGVGCINDELVLVDGAVEVKKYLMLCLTFDHRIIDGVEAAMFQQNVKKLLENPMDILV